MDPSQRILCMCPLSVETINSSLRQTRDFMFPSKYIWQDWKIIMQYYLLKLEPIKIFNCAFKLKNKIQRDQSLVKHFDFTHKLNQFPR